MLAPDLDHLDRLDWQDTLRPGDVVLFRFPLARRGACGEVAKTRPCLVLAIAGPPEDRRALVAYGTSADTRANRGKEVAVGTAHGIAAAGLDRPTRFVCARRICVPLTSWRFRTHPERGTPVLGHLAPAEQVALRRVQRAILADGLARHTP